MRTDFRPLLATLPTPTLALAGRHDPFVYPAALQRLATLMARTRVVVQDLGHGWTAGAITEQRRLLAAFLDAPATRVECGSSAPFVEGAEMAIQIGLRAGPSYVRWPAVCCLILRWPLCVARASPTQAQRARIAPARARRTATCRSSQTWRLRAPIGRMLLAPGQVGNQTATKSVRGPLGGRRPNERGDRDALAAPFSQARVLAPVLGGRAHRVLEAAGAMGTVAEWLLRRLATAAHCEALGRLDLVAVLVVHLDAAHQIRAIVADDDPRTIRLRHSTLLRSL